MFFFVIFVFCVLGCNGQDYSLARDEIVSEESSEQLNLVFNTSSKEMPERRHYEYVQNQVTTVTPRRLSDCAKDAKNTKGSEYPFSVSIQRKSAHYATGALIDSKWVLTAAGPFYNVRESIKLFRVLLGTVYCKRSGVVVAIRSVEVHPSYRYRAPSFDLALLQLAAPVLFSDVIKPVPMSTVRAKVVSAKFMTTYWPRLIVRGKVVPVDAQERVEWSSMRVSTQALVPWATCAAALHALREDLHDTSLCLNPILKYHTPCMPDVGGPVVAEDGLWGITSGWAPAACPSAPVPTLVTRVAPPLVRTWIRSIMLP